MLVETKINIVIEERYFGKYCYSRNTLFYKILVSAEYIVIASHIVITGIVIAAPDCIKFSITLIIKTFPTYQESLWEIFVNKLLVSESTANETLLYSKHQQVESFVSSMVGFRNSWLPFPAGNLPKSDAPPAAATEYLKLNLQLSHSSSSALFCYVSLLPN